MDEEGYIEPPIVDSARRRALVARNQKKVAELEKELAGLQAKLAEATAKKRGTERIEANIARVMAMIDRFSRTDPKHSSHSDDKADGDKIRSIRFVGSFAPDYEFDRADEAAVEELKRKLDSRKNSI